MRNNPDVPVFVAGDGDAEYQKVYDAMVLLQSGPACRKVGLMSQPPEPHAKQ